MNSKNNINPRSYIYNPEEIDESQELSPETVALFTKMLVNMIDERIRIRLEEQDIIKVHDARIEAINKTDDGTTITSIEVRYDEKFTVEISNPSLNQFPISEGQWIKICTYDGVQYYLLHAL